MARSISYGFGRTKLTQRGQRGRTHSLFRSHRMRRQGAESCRESFTSNHSVLRVQGRAVGVARVVQAAACTISDLNQTPRTDYPYSTSWVSAHHLKRVQGRAVLEHEAQLHQHPYRHGHEAAGLLWCSASACSAVPPAPPPRQLSVTPLLETVRAYI